MQIPHQPSLNKPSSTLSYSKRSNNLTRPARGCLFHWSVVYHHTLRSKSEVCGKLAVSALRPGREMTSSKPSFWDQSLSRGRLSPDIVGRLLIVEVKSPLCRFIGPSMKRVPELSLSLARRASPASLLPQAHTPFISLMNARSF